MVSKVSPKARATPRNPMWVPARTALPTPPKTSTKVPISSAAYFFMGQDLSDWVHEASQSYASFPPFHMKKRGHNLFPHEEFPLSPHRSLYRAAVAAYCSLYQATVLRRPSSKLTA